jgi:hypothetical protein
VGELASPALVEFVAYAEDRILSGQLALDADRLTDLLNDHEEIVLLDVLATDLRNGEGRGLPELQVARDELLLVHATGPRGPRARRVRTIRFPVALKTGPFDVRGYLHCLPGSKPWESFRRRRTMVPVTDAWIEHELAGTRQRRRVETLIVNRRGVDWIVEATGDEVEHPGLPLHTLRSPLSKDRTGHAPKGTTGAA